METTKEIAKSELELCSEQLFDCVEKAKDEIEDYFSTLNEEEYSENIDEKIREKIASMKRASANTRKSYLMTVAATDELTARCDDLINAKKRRFIPAAPTNTTIDNTERKSNHFAQGVNIYKLLLIFFVGNFVGVAVELLWCLFRYGYLESRSGLVWGPFNLVYGIGAVALTLGLYEFRNHRKAVSFVGGFLIGSLFEYACSWLQETFFGSTSWDYSDMPFNINGRICVLYSIFWGVLSVFWVKSLYPRIAKIILKIPNKIGKISCILVAVFFVVNSLVSGAAVYRWAQRTKGIPPKNSAWEIFDERFPDERMKKIYANLEFK